MNIPKEAQCIVKVFPHWKQNITSPLQHKNSAIAQTVTAYHYHYLILYNDNVPQLLIPHLLQPTSPPLLLSSSPSSLVTPSGLTSIPAGLETPEMIQLRKKKIKGRKEEGKEERDKEKSERGGEEKG